MEWNETDLQQITVINSVETYLNSLGSDSQPRRTKIIGIKRFKGEQ